MKTRRPFGTSLLGCVLATTILARPAASFPSSSVSSIFDFFGELNLVSVEQEGALAHRLAREVESKQRMVRDRRIGGFVSDVGHRLVAKLRSPEFDYRFRAVADRSLNAFNIGGGYVYVHTGLLEAARTEGELASVLAHEIGHQVKRHVAKAISRDQAFRTLASFAVGRNASQWVGLAAGLGITTGQLHFGREAEREADEVMVTLLVRAGYDPRQALGMFETIRSMEQSSPGRVTSIFSSHPPTSERIENVRRRLAETRVPAGAIRDSPRFREIRDLVRR